MIIYLENGNQIAGADLLSAILRHDLVPIPLSLEMTAHASDELKTYLQQGKKLTLGNGAEVVIVKSQAFKSQLVRDGRRSEAMAIVAVLSGCESLINATKKAVVHDAVTFSEIYRSLGAKVRFNTDVKVNSFACLKGLMPTKRIALALQKEAATIVYDIEARVFNVVRLQDLFKNEAALYDPSNVHFFDHSQANTLLNTNYLSVDEDGTQILGQAGEFKNIDYMPRCDSRKLLNLKRILITKGVIMRPMDDRLSAGKILLINEQKYVVLTNATRFDTGSFGGQAVMASKAWLAQMVDT